MPRLTLAVLVLALALPAQAQPRPALQVIDPDSARTILRFNETVEIPVTQDELVATLAVESRGSSAAAVQASVNRAMAAALERARAVPQVTAATERYSTWRLSGAGVSAVNAWVGSQTLVLTAQESAPLLELVGQLQGQNLAVRQLAFRVSRGLLQETRQKATDQALRALRGRAEQAAAALELAFDRFVQVDLEGDRGQPFPPPMAMAARASSDSAPPPVAQPAEVRVAVTVSAEAALKPR